MLLETLNNDPDSVIVYSCNLFGNENNFRMIFKNDASKTPRKVYLYDICGLINNQYPKNLIVYRLLTNKAELAVGSTTLGCMIRIGDAYEIIYSDPVYAIKELESIADENNNPDLRFRIQQVGLTSSHLEGGVHIFNELFQFDLDSVEAQKQDDTIFVDALVAQDKAGREVKPDVKLKDILLEVSHNGKEPFFHSLGRLKKKTKDYSKTAEELSLVESKSAIGVFKSGSALSSYIKEKGKRIILKFRN
jgi:hypothetical protein